MKQITKATGFLVLCLITFMFVAGCMSQNSPEQPATQQPAVTTSQPVEQSVTTPAAGVPGGVPDQGLVSDETGSVPVEVDTFNATEGTTLSSDSPDLGDIMP